jgi:hypothetical protein
MSQENTWYIKSKSPKNIFVSWILKTDAGSPTMLVVHDSNSKNATAEFNPKYKWVPIFIPKSICGCPSFGAGAYGWI